MHKRCLAIDGTDSEGVYCGWSDSPDHWTAPYAVFDIEKQDWITPDLRWLWLAYLLKWWHGGGWGY